MLRLGTLELSGDAPALAAVPPALITRALGSLASERLSNGAAGYAVEQFCAALIDDNTQAAQVCIDRLIACGVTVEAIYDAFIPRTAARLGDLWNEDHISFAAVTLGTSRLTEVFRKLSPIFLKDAPARQARAGGARQALFALAPGETHALGVVMAADYFRKNGWMVRVELTSDARTLESLVRDMPYDLIGLSCGCRGRVGDLTKTIDKLRSVAPPSARFALGGPITMSEPDLADRFGVDVALHSAKDAVTAIENLI